MAPDALVQYCSHCVSPCRLGDKRIQLAVVTEKFWLLTNYSFGGRGSVDVRSCGSFILSFAP